MVIPHTITRVSGPASAPGKPRTAPAIARAVRQPRSWVALGDLIETDPAFLLGSTVIKSLVQSTEIAIEGAGDSPRAQALTEDLTDLWYESLPDVLRSFGHGLAAFELVRKYDRETKLAVFEAEYLPAEHVFRRDNRDTGDFEGLTLRLGGQKVDLGPEECWWFGMDATSLRPHGKSRYQGAAHKVWAERQKLTENWGIYLEQFAAGRYFAYAPSSYSEPNGPASQGDVGQLDDDGTPASPIKDTADAIAETRSGGTTVLPSAVDPATGTPLFRVDAMAVQPNTQSLEFRERSLHDAALYSIGVPPRSVSQDAATGTYSMAQAHLEVLYDTVYGILDQIVKSFQKYIVDRLSAINFEKPPKLTLVYGKIDPTAVALVTEIVKSILQAPQASPLVTEGVVDFGKMLDLAGIPVGDNLAERLKAAKEAMAAQAQPAQPSLGTGVSQQMRLALPKSLDQDWETFEARAGREISPLLAEVYRILESAAETDDDGKVIGLGSQSRRRL